MHPLLLILLALSVEPAVGASTRLPVSTCTAERLSQFVGPTGIHQTWPVAESLPPQLASAAGQRLSDQGMVLDGYVHTLHVDPSKQSAYVVQQGGFAGLRTVYGPLPVAACPGAP